MEKETKSVITKCQEIEDLPTELFINGKRCVFSLEWDFPNYSDFKDVCCWNARYRDAETREIVIDCATGPKASYDWALSNLLNRLKHTNASTPDGNKFNIVECILYERGLAINDIHINKHFVIRPKFKYNSCPMCGNDKITHESYDTLGHSPLSGSRGTRHRCECGYQWEDIDAMA